MVPETLAELNPSALALNVCAPAGTLFNVKTALPPVVAAMSPALRVAPAVGVRGREATVRPEDLPAMSECFLLSSTKDVTPVGSIDGQTFVVGPDTVTAKLKAGFAAYARESATAHPELKV